MLLVLVEFKNGLHRGHTQRHVRPDAVDNETVVVDVEKFVWDCDGVDAGTLLILEVGVWDPHVIDTSLVQFQDTDVADMREVEARVSPCLSQKNVH